ncbi:hypothetical protein DS843_20405 [Roseomonas genomospecies 6]|uniref:Uncharacterized protein n=1 Tax=Roseomonas genomospecies 6 TaxID=214106 RepID=A0A9W7KRB2_9PROT|nr:hypothetical protein DS843_20405 [Roseomonas genomospecies 6]
MVGTEPQFGRCCGHHFAAGTVGGWLQDQPPDHAFTLSGDLPDLVRHTRQRLVPAWMVLHVSPDPLSAFHQNSSAFRMNRSEERA